MPVAQRGMRDVVEQRKNYGNSNNRKCVGVFCGKQDDHAEKRAERCHVIAQQYEAEPERIRLTKCCQGSRRSRPEIHESLCDQPHLDSRMRHNKCDGFSFFFFHESRLAHVQVAQDFAVLRDHAGPESALVVVIFVIADIQFECEIRPQRDEFVELSVVSDGPRHAAKKSDRGGKRCSNEPPGSAIPIPIAIGGPRQ